MSAPVLRCVDKEHREKDGFETFREWIEEENHVYIGSNIAKYAPGVEANEWSMPWEIKPFAKNMGRRYEAYLRSKDDLTDLLSTLTDKDLGCCCSSRCHGEVILKLYTEYVNPSKLNPRKIKLFY